MKASPQATTMFHQVMLMNFGFFGTQYSFGLQQTAINPTFSFLNLDPSILPYLNMADPVIGLIVQPLIGAMSDRTWIPGLGRHRPYFLISAIDCSPCLFLYPCITASRAAVLLLWLLDTSNNTAMEPFYVFIADTVPEHQQPTGFLMRSVLTGLGITLANISLYLLQQVGQLNQTPAAGIPYWVFGSSYIDAVYSIGSVLVTVLSTSEYEPFPEEMATIEAQPNDPIHAIRDIGIVIREMPTSLWQLASVYLSQWYALFVYWQYILHSIVQSVWRSISAGKVIYERAVTWAGLINDFYNVVTFIFTLGLMQMTRRYVAKCVHAFAVTLAALTLLAIPCTTDKCLMLASMTSFSIDWASVVGVPFMIVVHSIPKEHYGVYMDIVNMMIVTPISIETVTSSWVYKIFLGANPSNVMIFAGVLPVITTSLTVVIKTSNKPIGISENA